jgi:hypothetical protein
MTKLLFTPFRIGWLQLENRLVSLPMYLAYPDPDHLVNALVLDYYAEMAASGAGMVVAENTTVEPRGLGTIVLAIGFSASGSRKVQGLGAHAPQPGVATQSWDSIICSSPRPRDGEPAALFGHGSLDPRAGR